MGDLDCGNCDLNFDDCNCDCDCDCNCNDCGCCDCSSCFDNCCTGETDVILCCFPPLTGGTHNPRHTSTTPAHCFDCCRGERMPTSSKSSNKSKRKGFCRRLRSCFRSEPSPPSSPSRDQPKTESALPTGYRPDGRYPIKDGFGNVGPNHKQEDGRYPMSEGQFEAGPPGYKGRHWDQGSWEERDMGSRDHAMEWRWSKPVRHGGENKYGGHL